MEMFDQNRGLILYKTTLVGHNQQAENLEPMIMHWYI